MCYEREREAKDVICYQKNLYLAIKKIKSSFWQKSIFPYLSWYIREIILKVSVDYDVKFLVSAKSVKKSNKLNVVIAKWDIVVY